jgi:hypothetical protein
MFESDVKGRGNVANRLQKSLANAMKNSRKWGEATPEKPAKKSEKPRK